MGEWTGRLDWAPSLQCLSLSKDQEKARPTWEDQPNQANIGQGQRDGNKAGPKASSGTVALGESDLHILGRSCLFKKWYKSPSPTPRV